MVDDWDGGHLAPDNEPWQPPHPPTNQCGGGQRDLRTLCGATVTKSNVARLATSMILNCHHVEVGVLISRLGLGVESRGALVGSDPA